MKCILTAMFLLAPALGASQGVPGGSAPVTTEVSGEATTRNSSDWVIQQADHVSGVSNALQITNPAKISYDSLMDDTSEMKELKRKGIRKDSARGQVLVSAAKDRVRRAAKSVMTSKGHCSVWKKIRSKSGVSVTDLTEDVRKKLDA